jgi:isoamylase
VFRIDNHPTASHAGFDLRPGRPLPFGATTVPGGVNFSVFSRHATTCELVLFHAGEQEPFAVIPFPDAWRVGQVFTMVVFDLDIESLEYAYRMDGPFDAVAGHRFDRTRDLLDPYARLIAGREAWGETPDWTRPSQYRGRVMIDDFDWECDSPLGTPVEDLVIYEVHVRGFTAHPSAGVAAPGTYAAIREKIPYLKALGINCVELMPIQEFDEFDNSRPAPSGEGMLLNYWGYSTVGFFAPKAGYAATGRLGMQADELKATIKALHAAGIEVILDVVFNHTAEGDERGPYISFRGVDNRTYYILSPEGHYCNYSGCGNTLNCNNPIVRDMILDCLRHWVAEYHVDGFRFDLASILGRDQDGTPLANPPLLEALAHDPILGTSKLIAEAWDAGGLYQVGSFPSWGRWAEWNGRYRDDVRRFLRSEAGMASAMAERIAGSPDLYHWNRRGTGASINFITCHDGFTLHDLVAYDHKHNAGNGEDNRDGENENHSWNCGAEGPTTDGGVLALRGRQIRNAFAMLLVSQGTPMFPAGDEMGNTQHGNNNAYCQDNATSWLDWSLLDANADLHRFCTKLIAFRRAHPVLRNNFHFQYRDWLGSGIPDISFHGVTPWQPDFSDSARTFAFMLCGRHARDGAMPDNTLYVAMNMHWEDHDFALPVPPDGTRWHVAVDTARPAPDDIRDQGQELPLDASEAVAVQARSVVVLIAV